MSRILAIGEPLLRLSTAAGTRLSHAASLHAHYGGAESNLAISLSNYGHEAFFASKVPDSALGQAVRQNLQTYGVNTRFLLCGEGRLGCYYVDTGTGPRSSEVIYDRKDSAFAQMGTMEWNLDELFKGVDLLHLSGITPAVSPSMRRITLDLLREAKSRNILVSFDMNYRRKLWSEKEAQETYLQILPHVDYCSAGKKDALYTFGIPENGSDRAYYYHEMQRMFPNISCFYSTKRKVISVNENHLQGTLWHSQSYYSSPLYTISPITDRIGGGDAFAGGVLHGLLCGWEPQHIIDFGTAAAVLKHTIAGDSNQFSAAEVEQFITNHSDDVSR